MTNFSIHYFPEFTEDEPQPTPPVLAKTLKQKPPSGATAEIQDQLQQHRPYLQAIAKLQQLSKNPEQTAQLIAEIVETTIKQTLATAPTTAHKPFQFKSLPQLAQPKPEKIDIKALKAEKFQEVGQILKAEREKQGISRLRLNQLTYVLTYHIEAIEAGQLEKLPEDLYVKGFILRIANALHLDGVALANSIPFEAVPVLASWDKPEDGRDRHFPIEIAKYLGYTALIASGIGGLSWTAQKINQDALAKELPAASEARADTKIAAQQAAIAQPKIKLTPPAKMN